MSIALLLHTVLVSCYFICGRSNNRVNFDMSGWCKIFPDTEVDVFEFQCNGFWEMSYFGQ